MTPVLSAGEKAVFSMSHFSRVAYGVSKGWHWPFHYALGHSNLGTWHE